MLQAGLKWHMVGNNFIPTGSSWYKHNQTTIVQNGVEVKMEDI